jgi:hypothetical protein
MVHHGWVESRVPRERDWEEAARIIDGQHEEGDLVVIAPWWASQGWKHLGRFMTVEQMSRDDDRGYGRIWEVALPGYRHDEYATTGKLVSEERAGRLTVRRYQFPDAPRTIYDFVGHLEEEATVTMLPERGTPEPCTFRPHPKTGTIPNAVVQSGKFKCDPRLPWNTVDREVIADLDNKPRLCIWAHPVDRKRVAIRFDGVPAGSVIEGYTARRYEADREVKGRPPVFVEIKVGGEVIGTAMHEEHGGWTPYRFELGPGFQGGSVSFEIWSAQAGMAHFCFTAKLRDR